MGTPDVDLTDQSIRETQQKLGELAQICLRKDRIALFLLRADGIVTITSPKLIGQADPADVAGVLLDSWSEQQIEEFLGYLDGRDWNG
jgi:hypothetical protein